MQWPPPTTGTWSIVERLLPGSIRWGARAPTPVYLDEGGSVLVAAYRLGNKAIGNDYSFDLVFARQLEQFRFDPGGESGP